MDIKSRSNGERQISVDSESDMSGKGGDMSFFEEELYADKPGKRHGNPLILLIVGILLSLFCFVGITDINYYNRSVKSNRAQTMIQEILLDNTETAFQVKEELTRYEKNLQRYFIHYKGFDPENPLDITKPTEQEIKSLQMEHEVAYQNAVREINERYDSEIKPLEESIKERSKTAVSPDPLEETITQNNAVIENSNRYKYDPELAADFNEYTRLIEVRDKMIYEVGEKYLLSDEEASKILEQSKQENSIYDVSNYYDIKAYLESTSYFKYCLMETKNNEYMTNIPVEQWAGFDNPMQYVEQASQNVISIQDGFFATEFNGKPLNESFKEADIRGNILIIEESSGDDPVSRYNFEKIVVADIYRRLTLAVVAVFIVAAIIWVLFLKARKSALKEAAENTIKVFTKIPLTVKASLAIVSVLQLFALQQVQNIGYTCYRMGFMSMALPNAIMLLLCTISVLYLLMCATQLWAFMKNPGLLLCEPEIRWVGGFLKNIALVYSQQITSISLSLSFLIFMYIIAQAVLIFVTLKYFHTFNVIVVFFVFEFTLNALALYVFNLISALAKTNKYMEAIISGNLDVEINEKCPYKTVINKQNRLRGGVRRVVVEKNKSEKMKADLITNVSHDLKTPLTSIINYIELLKTPNISEADRAEYIEVLDKKSQRVKLLIDDLFEATKLSSGQITLEKTTLNIVNLIKQAVGELEEKFNSVGIVLKLTYSREDILISADGKKLWRVFENLFTNIIKYSQPGTRAYVDITEDDFLVRLSFKNISFYEMNFEYDEMFERFKRGDVARATEGSGLGLSIAKDIVELHSGTMEISIDGDLFKVMVLLPVE